MLSFIQTIVMVLLTVACFQHDSSTWASRSRQRRNQVAKDIVIEGKNGVIRVDGKIFPENDDEFKRGHVHVYTSKGLICINDKVVYDSTVTSSQISTTMYVDNRSVTHFKINAKRNGEFGYEDDHGEIELARSANLAKKIRYLKGLLAGDDENSVPKEEPYHYQKSIQDIVIKGEHGQITVKGEIVRKMDEQFKNGIVHLNVFDGVVYINDRKIYGKSITCPGNCPSMELNFDEGVTSFEMVISRNGRVEYKDNRQVIIGGSIV
ncbi:uncharacterized protein LOC135848922 [Planococcus citri]|uniref:uncharacterized protein LOC135848922 n=1 Tax=Planococcus citri TaxID=170843 RepID=UPI0031F9D643